MRPPRSERSIATSAGMREYWRRPNVKRLRRLGAKRRRIEQFIACMRPRVDDEYIAYHEARLAEVNAEIALLKET